MGGPAGPLRSLYGKRDGNQSTASDRGSWGHKRSRLRYKLRKLSRRRAWLGVTQSLLKSLGSQGNRNVPNTEARNMFPERSEQRPMFLIPTQVPVLGLTLPYQVCEFFLPSANHNADRDQTVSPPRPPHKTYTVFLQATSYMPNKLLAQ